MGGVAVCRLMAQYHDIFCLSHSTGKIFQTGTVERGEKHVIYLSLSLFLLLFVRCEADGC